MTTENPENTETPQNVSPPVISDSMIKEAVANAVKAETEKIAKQSISQEEVQRLVANTVAEDRQKMADLISGRSNAPQVNPIHKTFVDDPNVFVETIGDILIQRTRAEREAERAEERKAYEKEQEMQKAFNEVVADRKDVLGNQASKDIWANFYRNTSPDKSEAERMREATVSFDKAMDELKVDRSKISRAVSIEGSGGLPQVSHTQVSFEEDARQSQREKFEAHEKAMGRA